VEELGDVTKNKKKCKEKIRKISKAFKEAKKNVIRAIT